MNTKLTLSLDQKIIESAKEYAKKHNISLSSLIENYLQKLITEYHFDKAKKGSIVEELSGIINLENDFDHKKELYDHLNKKYK
jgi:hypothetical protein